jgi:hypothetical protein
MLSNYELVKKELETMKRLMIELIEVLKEKAKTFPTRNPLSEWETKVLAVLAKCESVLKPLGPLPIRLKEGEMPQQRNKGKMLIRLLNFVGGK